MAGIHASVVNGAPRCFQGMGAMRNRTSALARLFTVLLCLGLTGCLVRDGVAVHVSGPQLDPEKVAWIVRGETSEADIASRFGSPTFVIPTARGKMIIYREVWQRTSVAGIIFTTKTITNYDEFLFVEITDGMVANWILV